MTPAVPQPPPVQQYQPPPMPPLQPQMYQPQQVYYTAPPPPVQYAPAPVMVPAPEPPAAYNSTNIHIRDVSPARSYTTAGPSMPSMHETSVALVRARSRSRGPTSMAMAPVIYDAGSPAVEVAEEPLAVAIVDNRRRSKSRHRHRHSHSQSTHHRSRSHSHGGDGALYAHFHDRRDRDHDDRYYDVTVDDRYYREERDYYEPVSSGREMVRAERLSTGELVLYQEQVERVEEPRNGVRIEKDRKGRMAISVPKYR